MATQMAAFDEKASNRVDMADDDALRKGAMVRELDVKNLFF